MIDTTKTLTVRERLTSKLARVPRSIAAAGYQATINYKEWLASARKAASNPRTTEHQLVGLLNHYEALDREAML